MKIWVKGVARGSRDHFGEFWYPLHISATVEARRSKGVVRELFNLLLDILGLSISRERLKVETRNLSRRLTQRRIIVKMQN